LLEVFARFWAPRGFAAVPDEELDRIAELWFDYLWIMGVWTLGRIGQRISSELHPDFSVEDVVGSPYAVARYEVDPRFGGDAALADLRARLAKRNIQLIVDFVPNHTARDHHWVTEHPEVYVHDPDGIAAGKDPYLAPWTDTAQLDHRLAVTRRLLIETLARIADRADGVRCDMAMLALPEVFESTWRSLPPAADQPRASGELWADAIDHLAGRPFTWIAETYWGLETRLQLLGFDFTYDKTLYDRLVHGDAPSVRAHLGASLEYQSRSVRFLENHDELRLAQLLPQPRATAALAVTLTVPGMRMIHEGQIDGCRIRTNIHLGKRPEEPIDVVTRAAHLRLLEIARTPAVRSGSFAMLTTRDERLIAHRWEHPEGSIVVIVNYSGSHVQSLVVFDLHGIAGRTVDLADCMNGAVYTRDGSELVDPHRGLYVDLAPWQAHVFAVRTRRL
jgi:glycosidase